MEWTIRIGISAMELGACWGVRSHIAYRLTPNMLKILQIIPSTTSTSQTS